VTGREGAAAGDLVSWSDEAAFLWALGKRVRLLRLTRELTQEQVADAAGMSRSFFSLIEHGCRGVDVVRLLRLAAEFGVPLTELLDLGTPVPVDRAAA
jgi:transcriptional regulator with XRE-family HTH domain